MVKKSHNTSFILYTQVFICEKRGVAASIYMAVPRTANGYFSNISNKFIFNLYISNIHIIGNISQCTSNVNPILYNYGYVTLQNISISSIINIHIILGNLGQ